jgi:hypothetical protein
MTTDNPALVKAASDLQIDAVYLHAMVQGIDALYDTIEVKSCPASNALPAFLKSLMQWADKMANDIEALETNIKPAGQVKP